MWIIDVLVAGVSSRYYLTAGTYTIGRKEGCDLFLSSAVGDTSLSRLHATLQVISVQARYSSSPDHVPELYVADHSKHGTYVNNDRIAAHEVHRKLMPADVLRLGMHVKLMVAYAPLIVAVAPMLSSFEQRDMHLVACRLGAVLCDPLSPTDLHSASIPVMGFLYCTHEVSGDDGASLFALLYRYTLVSPDYLSTLADVLKGTPNLPMPRWPQPRAFDAMRSRALSDRLYFRPAPTFFDADAFLASAPPNAPTHMFRTLRLLTLDATLALRYGPLIAAAGGKLVSVRVGGSDSASHEDGLVSVTDALPLPLDDLVSDSTDAHGFGSFLLVDRNDFRSLADVLEAHRAADREALRASASQLSTYLRLWERGLRVVDEDNIHAALYANGASNEFRADAPGVLSRSVMEVLPEVDDVDSNATECGITPYQPQRVTISGGAGAAAAPRLALSPIRVCRPEQLAGSSARRSTPTPLISDDAPAGPSANRKDLYKSWKEGAAAAAVPRAPSPSRWKPPQSVAAVPVAAAVRTVAAPPRDVSPTRVPLSKHVSPSRSSPAPRGGSPLRRGSFMCATAARPRPTSDAQLHKLCTSFEQDILPSMTADIERCCASILQAGFVNGQNLSTITNTNNVFAAFLAALTDAESALATSVLTSNTRRAAYRLRDTIQTVQRAVRATYRTVGIVAPMMVSPRRCVSPSASITNHSPVRSTVARNLHP